MTRSCWSLLLSIALGVAWVGGVEGHGAQKDGGQPSAPRPSGSVVTVELQASLQGGLPWRFWPDRRVIRARRGETIRALYRARNLSERATTGKAVHTVVPEGADAHVDLLECFCFVQTTLAAGEERTFPLAFRLRPTLSRGVVRVVLRYEFAPDVPAGSIAAVPPRAAGMVEVVSSLHRDGRPVARDLRWGVYVTFRAPTEYVRRCFREYGLRTDRSGAYAAMYRPYHLIGLELGVSIASAVLRNEPTGAPQAFVADVVACAKRDLEPGEVLDGEGGYTVYGRLVRAAASREARYLPLGLAHGVKLTRRVKRDEVVPYHAASLPEGSLTVELRRELVPGA